MATITVCDGGCGAQSPDAKARGGPHVANHWFRVRAHSNIDFDRRSPHDDKLFCKTCETRIRRTLGDRHDD